MMMTEMTDNGSFVQRKCQSLSSLLLFPGRGLLRPDIGGQVKSQSRQEIQMCIYMFSRSGRSH